MAEMTKAIKLTPHGPNVHLKLSDVLSQGSIILGFPCLSDEQVEKNAENIRQSLSRQTTACTAQEEIKIQLVDVQIKKTKYEQVKDAKDRFNAKAGPDDPHLTLIRILTEAQTHIIAVRDDATDTGHPAVYFKTKKYSNDVTEHDNDASTFFVIFDYVRPNIAELTRFVNCHTWLPMGTLEKFEKDHNNNPRLYTYGNANVQPPTETEYDQILSELAQKFKKSDQLQSDLFYFKIHGSRNGDPAVVYPSYIINYEIVRISKESKGDDNEPNAVISDSKLSLIITED